MFIDIGINLLIILIIRRTKHIDNIWHIWHVDIIESVKKIIISNDKNRAADMKR